MHNAQKSSSESTSSGNRMLSRIANFLMGAGGTEDGEVDSSSSAAASNNNLEAADLASAATMAQPIPNSAGTAATLANARLRQIEVEGDDWILVDQHVDGPSTTGATAQQQQAGMDESWYVTPPACFTQPGPVHVETSPLEDLLIEHPSMSVYRSASSEASLGLGSQLRSVGVGGGQHQQQQQQQQHPRKSSSSKQHRQRRIVPKSMVVVKAVGVAPNSAAAVVAPLAANDNHRGGRLATMTTRMPPAAAAIIAAPTLPPRFPLTSRNHNVLQNQQQQHNQQQLMQQQQPMMEPKLTHRQRQHQHNHHHHHHHHLNQSHHHNQQHNTSPHRCNNNNQNYNNDNNQQQQVVEQQPSAQRRSSVKDLRNARGDENLRIIQMRSAQKMLEKRSAQSSKRKCLERGNKVREVASTGKARRPRRQDRLRLNNSNANNNRKC